MCNYVYIFMLHRENRTLPIKKKKKKREENSEMAGERGKVEEEKNDYLGV